MDWLTALIFAIGAGAWTYSYLMKNTMRTQSSLIGGGVVGAIGFVVVFTLMKFVFHF